MTNGKAGGLNTQQTESQSESALGSQIERLTGALDKLFDQAEAVDPDADIYGHARSSLYDNAAKLLKGSAKLGLAVAKIRGKRLEKNITIRNEHIGFIPKSLVAVPSEEPVIDATPLPPEPEPEPVSVFQMELPPHNEYGGLIKIGPSIRSAPGEPLDIEWAEPGDVYDPKMQLGTGEVFVEGKGWVQPPRKNFQNSQGSSGNSD